MKVESATKQTLLPGRVLRALTRGRLLIWVPGLHKRWALKLPDKPKPTYFLVKNVQKVKDSLTPWLQRRTAKLSPAAKFFLLSLDVQEVQRIMLCPISNTLHDEYVAFFFCGSEAVFYPNTLEWMQHVFAISLYRPREFNLIHSGSSLTFSWQLFILE